MAVDDDGQIVGHVMINWTELHHGDVVHSIAMLSPLAVAPERHKQGIGSMLVREATARSDAAGDKVMVLEGSPTYYPRFGFVDSRTLGITIHLPDWASPEAGQALKLSSYHPSLRGIVVYPPPFQELE